MGYYPAIKRSEGVLTRYNMDGPRRCQAKRKEPVKEKHILYDSFYMKSPEQASLWRQKTDECLPGAGGPGEGSKCYWCVVSFWSDEVL